MIGGYRSFFRWAWKLPGVHAAYHPNWLKRRERRDGLKSWKSGAIARKDATTRHHRRQLQNLFSRAAPSPRVPLPSSMNPMKFSTHRS